MNKLIFSAVLLIAAFSVQAEEKFLSFQFNDKVEIRIANVPCPIKSLKQAYPWSAVAMRVDGQYMFGCFNHQDDDIVIQWAAGDKSIFPANYFLAKPNT